MAVGIQRAAIDALALPVGVVDGVRLRGGRGFGFRLGLRLRLSGVVCGDFAQGELDRPAIGGDVVDDEGEDVFFRLQAIEPGAQQG